MEAGRDQAVWFTSPQIPALLLSPDAVVSCRLNKCYVEDDGNGQIC